MDDEGRAAFQATSNLLQGFEALVVRDEMEGQNGCGSIERTYWGIFNIAFVQLDACGVRRYHALGQPKHIGRWVHAIERPT